MMTNETLVDTIRAAEVGYPECVAALLAIELRAWAELGYLIALPKSYVQMNALVAQIHQRELDLKEAAADPLEAFGA
jgi:hypothetical protein